MSMTCYLLIRLLHFSIILFLNHLFFKLGFTPSKAEQPLQGMELQEKEA